MNNISAVVVTWNRFGETVESITSIQKGAVPCRSIIVVDNGSTDGSGSKLRKHFENEPGVRIVEMVSNGGFASGANAGIREALKDEPEFVFLLNDDATVDDNCLAELAKGMSAFSACGIAGPAILFHGERRKIWQGGGRFSRLRGGVVVPDKDKWYEEIDKDRREVAFLSGCALLIRSEVFSVVGMFDERYFMYGEDTDLCLRAEKAGIRLLYVPGAVAYHKIGEGSGERATGFVLYHIARSVMLLYRKAFSDLYLLYGLFLQIFLFTPFRVVQLIKAGAGFGGFVLWFKGLWDGLIERPVRRQ